MLLLLYEKCFSCILQPTWVHAVQHRKYIRLSKRNEQSHTPGVCYGYLRTLLIVGTICDLLCLTVLRIWEFIVQTKSYSSGIIYVQKQIIAGIYVGDLAPPS